MAVLDDFDIEYPDGAVSRHHRVNVHLPHFVQRDLGFASGQVDVLVGNTKASSYRTTPRFLEPHRFNKPGRIAHIPEIRSAAFKDRAGPGSPNPVMMQMVRWIIICKHQPVRGIDRMDVPATLENWWDVRTG